MTSNVWTRSPQAVRNATRYLFLLTLLYAPWAYGCTTAETIVGLNYLLGTVLCLWVGDLLWRRRWPEVPRGLWVLALALLLLGWGMTINAKAAYDSWFHVFVPTTGLIPSLPGSFDQVNSVAFMIRCTLLVGSICFVADLVQRPAWLLRLWSALAIAGGSIALLGLVQKGSGARMIFWDTWPENDPPSFFATYFYHANAGAFLNLAFPVTVGIAARALISRISAPVRTWWSIAALAVTMAILANTSRAAQFIGVLLMLTLAALAWPHLRRVVRRVERLNLAVGAVIVLLAIGAVAQASRLDRPLRRWADLGSTLRTEGRVGAVETAWPAAADARWFGFGPGTFRSIFPHYVSGPESTTSGTWRFLHEDYLQTLLEWGVVGSAGWAALFFGGMTVAVKALRRSSQSWLPRQRLLLPLVLLSLTTVALHALVDFPLQIASIQLFAAALLGVCWGARSWGERVSN